MLRVSIIIPAHNGEHFIAQAINSVLQQTYSNYEIIVVDDGSTDSTRTILQNFDNKIRYVYQENQGVAIARNLGIEKAQGDLISFLDQDDFFLPDKLAMQVSRFEEEPNLGLVNSGWRVVDQAGELYADVEPWHHLPQLDIANWIVWKPVFPGALMVRRTLLQQANGFDSRFQQTSDVELVLRLVSMGCQTDWVKQVTVCYRQHHKNTSRNVIQQTEELETVLNKFFECPSLPVSILEARSQSYYQSYIWSAWRLYQYGYAARMASCLEKSLQHSKKTRTETILDWLNTFTLYAREYPGRFDISEVIESDEWVKLVYKCLKKNSKGDFSIS